MGFNPYELMNFMGVIYIIHGVSRYEFSHVSSPFEVSMDHRSLNNLTHMKSLRDTSSGWSQLMVSYVYNNLIYSTWIKIHLTPHTRKVLLLRGMKYFHFF